MSYEVLISRHLDFATFLIAKQHGHSRVPQNSGPLGRWVNQQRGKCPRLCLSRRAPFKINPLIIEPMQCTAPSCPTTSFKNSKALTSSGETSAGLVGKLRPGKSAWTSSRNIAFSMGTATSRLMAALSGSGSIASARCSERTAFQKTASRYLPTWDSTGA